MEQKGRSDDIGTSVASRLRDLGRRVTPTEISDIWVFPPLPHLEGSGEFLLFTRILPDEMRHLCGAEFVEWTGEALVNVAGNGNGNGDGNGHGGNGNGNGHEDATGPDLVRRITEYGAMPRHRVPRVVAGFRERLGDHREPVHFEIGGCPESWRRIIEPEEPAPD